VKDEKASEWYLDGQLAGTYQSSRKLTVVVVKDGSHMLAVENSKVSLDIFNRFIGAPTNGTSKPRKSEEESDSGKEKHSGSKGVTVIFFLLLISSIGYIAYARRLEIKKYISRVFPSAANERRNW
jgi:hypothetical protein